MADIDPIEISFIVNNAELKEQLLENMAAIKNFDTSTQTAKNSFSDFVSAQMQSINALSQNASLTDKQAKAIQTMANQLEWLKEKMAETTDTTQLGVYEYQLKQIQTAMQNIMDVANQKVELLDPAEIAAANTKLDEAVKLLDKISDTHINSDFASPEELEVLSNAINATDDGMQQLATVIDFVSSKMKTMDSSSEGFKELQADVLAAKQLLGTIPEAVDVTGQSINQMVDALKLFGEQLETETDPQAIIQLNQNIEKLENKINQVKNAGKTGFDEFGNKIKEQKTESVTLQTELKNLVEKMAQLKIANKDNSEEYQELKARAIEVRDAIGVTQQEINKVGTNATKFSRLIDATTSIVSGFTAAQGAAALFGVENENAEKTIQKVTGAMALLQGLQQIQMELKQADTVATGQQTLAQSLYTTVVGTSTGAVKAFRIALASTGIGLIVLLIGALVANWDKITESIKKNIPWLNNFGDKLDTMKSYIMGFLNAYLSLYKTVFNTIMKLINLDFKGALNEVKNTVKNAKEAGTQAKQKSDEDNYKVKVNERLDHAVKNIDKEIEIEEAAGRKSDALKRRRFEILAQRYKDDKEKFAENEHEKAVFEAGVQRKINDDHKKALDKRQKDAETAAKKAKELAEKSAREQAEVRKKITDEIAKLNTKENDGNEIAKIKAKWDGLKSDAQKKGLGKEKGLMMDIDVASAKEQYMAKYKAETEAQMKSLKQQQEIYAAYEGLKTSLAKTEFAKRNGLNIEAHATFSEILDDEIKKLQKKENLSDLEQKRLDGLKNLKTEVDTGDSKKDFAKFEKAGQDTILYYEQMEAIDKEYADKKEQLQKITDEKLRNAKLAENERQKQEAVDAVNEENAAKITAYYKVGDQILKLTRQQLKDRLKVLKDALQNENLTDDQKGKLGKSITDTEKLLGKTEQQTKINQLIEERNRLEQSANDITDKTSKAWQDVNVRIEEVNRELKGINAVKFFSDTKEWAGFLKGAFGDLSSAIGDSNQGLADTLDTMSDLAGLAENLASAGENLVSGLINGFTQGGVMGIVSGVIGAIGGLLSMGKKARESERKAQEEIKKRQAEQLQAQLDYNATLRQRMIDEVKINDLYRSRVDNIKMEMEARKKAMEKNLKDQQALFNKLLNMTTVVGQTTEKYGGFLGIGRKTRVVDIKQTIGNLLGVGNGANPFTTLEEQMMNNPFFKMLYKGDSPFKNLIPPDTVVITDDMFEKLEKINAEHPLTGDAKTAYEQLKKLRDEYGSFEEANRQLEIQLKNAITGTTAQTLADSIREGLKSGKKSFADFANDIEGFLREAILAGISAKMIEPKIQELQDAMAEMMGDGILTPEERQKFQEMYMAIVNSSQEYMDMINQSGINMTTGVGNANSLQGAIKGMSQESADILSGQLGGMRLAQLDTNVILKQGFYRQMEDTSKMIGLQMDIERNTKQTAENTGKLYDVNDNVVKVVNGQDKYYKALQAAGIIK